MSLLNVESKHFVKIPQGSSLILLLVALLLGLIGSLMKFKPLILMSSRDGTLCYFCYESLLRTF